MKRIYPIPLKKARWSKNAPFWKASLKRGEGWSRCFIYFVQDDCSRTYFGMQRPLLDSIFTDVSYLKFKDWNEMYSLPCFYALLTGAVALRRRRAWNKEHVAWWLGSLRAKRSVASSSRRSPTNTQHWSHVKIGSNGANNMDKAMSSFALAPSFTRADFTPSHWATEATAI